MVKSLYKTENVSFLEKVVELQETFVLYGEQRRRGRGCVQTTCWINAPLMVGVMTTLSRRAGDSYGHWP